VHSLVFFFQFFAHFLAPARLLLLLLLLLLHALFELLCPFCSAVRCKMHLSSGGKMELQPHTAAAPTLEFPLFFARPAQLCCLFVAAVMLPPCTF